MGAGIYFLRVILILPGTGFSSGAGSALGVLEILMAGRDNLMAGRPAAAGAAGFSSGAGAAAAGAMSSTISFRMVV